MTFQTKSQVTKSLGQKSLRQRALDYLGKREYSYAELKQKLKAYAGEDDEQLALEEITAILDDFKKRGWLSDARFTEQMIHARRAKFGLSRIANELREKGVAEDLVDDAIDKLKETEFESATIVWCKKYKATPTSREEWARQARFLQSRGFGFDVIKKVLNNIEDND